MVDVSPANPGNFLEGVAILTSPAGDVVTPDLTGAWQVTLYGQGGCGVGTSLVTFTLNSSGNATNATNTSHTAGCGDSTTYSGPTGFNRAHSSLDDYGRSSGFTNPDACWRSTSPTACF